MKKGKIEGNVVMCPECKTDINIGCIEEICDFDAEYQEGHHETNYTCPHCSALFVVRYHYHKVPEIKIEEIKVYTEKELGVILPVTPLERRAQKNRAQKNGEESSKKQKGDIVIFYNGKEITTLECTKTRGKSVTIREDKFEKLLRGDSEAIIFSTGNTTMKFATILFDSEENRMNFVDYLKFYLKRKEDETE